MPQLQGAKLANSRTIDSKARNHAVGNFINPLLFIAAFGKSCRRCGHVFSAHIEAVRKPRGDGCDWRAPAHAQSTR
jgi:hypothetical protein